jgi:LmbE family N-acetylglucosaminyl deacetylase
MDRPEQILVLAAHPDDEVLGCGGAMAHHADIGDAVDIIFVADGVYSRERNEEQKKSECGRRREAAQTAAQILGARPPYFVDFPDQRLDQLALLDIVQSIERLAREIKPTIIYTHHYGDLNTDHRTVAEAALTAFRPLPGSTVKAIYGFEILSSTEWRFGPPTDIFNPTRFLDITKTWARKLKALYAYHDEMRAFPHSRSYETVEALARIRGSAAGLEAAEAFSIYREIVPCTK